MATINVCQSWMLIKTLETRNHGHTCRDALGANFLRDILKGIAHFLLLWCALPIGVQDRASFLATLPATSLFGIGTDLSGSKDTPWGEGETLRTCHRDNIALEGSFEDGPLALINAERSLPVIPCVLICFGNDPRWGI